MNPKGGEDDDDDDRGDDDDQEEDDDGKGDDDDADGKGKGSTGSKGDDNDNDNHRIDRGRILKWRKWHRSHGANDIFNHVQQAQDPIFLVRAWSIETYNEEVHDLLSINQYNISTTSFACVFFLVDVGKNKVFKPKDRKFLAYSRGKANKMK